MRPESTPPSDAAAVAAAAAAAAEEEEEAEAVAAAKEEAAEMSDPAAPTGEAALSEGAGSGESGQVLQKVQLTRSPLLSRTSSVVPSCWRRQNRSVPSDSLICQTTPRLPTNRCTRSCAISTLSGSRTMH
jgi:hypothetical protein